MLLAYKQFHKSNNSISVEYSKVIDSLKKAGFLNLNSQKIKTDSIIFMNIYLNEKIDSIILSHASIPFQKIFKIAKKKEQLSNRLKIPFYKLEETLNTITSYYEEKGDSFVEVSLTQIELRKNRMFTLLLLKNNKERKIDKVIIKGYPEFPKKLLKNEFLITNNTIFNKKRIAKIDQLILNIDYLSLIKPSEILFSKDSTILYIYAEKKSKNYFDGLIGFSTNEENAKLAFNGNLLVELNNSFNKGEKLKINWQNSTSKINNLALSYFTTYIYNSKISPTIHFSIAKQDSTYTNTKLSAHINYKLNLKNGIGVIYEKDNSKILQNNTGDDFKEYKKQLVGASYILKSTTATNYSIEFQTFTGRRKANNKSTPQNKFSLFSNLTIPVSEKSAFEIKTSGEILHSKSYIQNELFRIGGSNSLRGFDEYSVWTNAYTLTNLEYHFKLDSSNSIYTITDYAYVNNSITKQDFNLFGVGLGYTTTSAKKLINLGYVLGKQNETPFNFKNSKFHINIVYFF